MKKVLYFAMKMINVRLTHNLFVYGKVLSQI